MAESEVSIKDAEQLEEGQILHQGELVNGEEYEELPADSGGEGESREELDEYGLLLFGKNKDLVKYHVVSSQAELDELRQQNQENSFCEPKDVFHIMKYVKADGKIRKLWECAICSRDFRHQYTLARHLPTHTDERKFKCDVCDKAFRQMSTLAQHKATHSNARPYVCEICQKTFNRVSTLILHRKIHFDDKPHKCQVCGRGFHQRGNLKNHMFSHTDERPYRCELCGRGFNQMSNLVVHKGKAHGQVSQGAKAKKSDDSAAAGGSMTRFVCEVCGKGFQKRNALRSHEESQHNVKLKSTKKNHTPKTSWKPTSDATKHEESEVLTSGLLIEAIATSSMEEARQANRTAFALLKSVDGTPSLVKVYDLPNDKQLLVQATAEDIQAAVDQGSGVSTSTAGKSLQVKISVVATVTQQVDEQGQMTVRIEAGSEKSSVAVEQPITEEHEAEPMEEDTEQMKNEGIQFIRSLPNGEFEIISEEEAAGLLEMEQVEAQSDVEEGQALDFLQLGEENAKFLLTEDNQLNGEGSEEAEIIISQGEDGELIVQGNQLEFLLGPDVLDPKTNE